MLWWVCFIVYCLGMRLKAWAPNWGAGRGVQAAGRWCVACQGCRTGVGMAVLVGGRRTWASGLPKQGAGDLSYE